MTAALPQPLPTPESRVTAAVDEIVSAMMLKPAAKMQLAAFVGMLAGDGIDKLPHVSFYAAKTKSGAVNWRITYRVPGYRRRTERLGRLQKPAYLRAKRVSEILSQVAARMMKRDDAYRMLYVDSAPIDKHVTEFVASVRSKGVNADYLASTETRLRRCIELAEYGRLGDITLTSLPELTEKLKTYIEPGKKKPLGSTTINYYLAVLRQFVRWAKGTGRISENTLEYSKGVKNTTKKKRRDLLIEELSEIVSTVRANKIRCKMNGDDRAMLYLTAFGTGLRRKELRASQAEWLKLDGKTPSISLPGSVTKDGKDATQPLPTWLAAELAAWLGDRTTGPIWPYMHGRVADIFDADRERARSEWIKSAPAGKDRDDRTKSDFLKQSTVDGELVFHSLRHAYASTVVANMDLKSAQMLTRHATAAILADRYAHSRLKTAHEGVERSIKNPVKALAQGAAQVDGKKR